MSEDEKEPEDTWFVVVSKDEPLSFPQTLAGLKSYEDAAARKEALETLKLRGGHPQQILRVRGTPLRYKMIKSKSTTFISATRIDDTQRTLPEEQELEESPILSVPVNKLVPSETEKVERLLETLQLAARGQPGWTFVGPHEQYILKMKRYLDSGGELEPITVKKMPGGRYRVTDGHHRLAIALSKGQDSLDAVLEPEDSSTEIDQLESVDPVSLLLEDEGQSTGTNDLEVIREIFAGILGKPQIEEVSKFFTDAQAEDDALQRGLSVYTYDDGSGSLGAIRTDNGYMPIEMSDGQEREYVRIGPVTMSRRVFALKPGEAIETSGYKGNSDFEPIWTQRDEEGLKFSARDGEPLMALSDDVASELAGMWNADEDRKNVPEAYTDIVPEIVPKQVDERGAEEIYKMKKGIEEMTHRKSQRTLPEEQRLEADDEDEDNPEGAALPKKKNVLKDIREERAHLKKHGKFRYSTLEAEAEAVQLGDDIDKQRDLLSNVEQRKPDFKELMYRSANYDKLTPMQREFLRKIEQRDGIRKLSETGIDLNRFLDDTDYFEQSRQSHITHLVQVDPDTVMYINTEGYTYPRYAALIRNYPSGKRTLPEEQELEVASEQLGLGQMKFPHTRDVWKLVQKKSKELGLRDAFDATFEEDGTYIRALDDEFDVYMPDWDTFAVTGPSGFKDIEETYEPETVAQAIVDYVKSKRGEPQRTLPEEQQLEMGCGARRVVKDVKRENAVTKIMEAEGDVESASNECGKRRAL